MRRLDFEWPLLLLDAFEWLLPESALAMPAGRAAITAGTAKASLRPVHMAPRRPAGERRGSMLGRSFVIAPSETPVARSARRRLPSGSLTIH